jgi:hypothetical protein
MEKTMTTNQAPSNTTSQKVFKKHFEMFKGNNSAKGAYFSFEDRTYKKEDPYCFLTMAPQKTEKNNNGNFTFDYDSKARLKIGKADLMKLLGVFSGVVESIKLYHQYKENNTTFEVKPYNGSLSISISEKREGKLYRASIIFDACEALTFKCLLERSTQTMYA